MLKAFASGARPGPTHKARLHAAYTKLTFRCLPGDHQDARRERFFKRLVLHHLLATVMYTLADWATAERQQQCIEAFILTYAKRLWPAAFVNRQHLAVPVPKARKNVRSFYGGIDAKYGSPVGHMVTSKIGEAFGRYVEVLLEEALDGAQPEDVEWLVQGILSVEMGPEVSPVKVEVDVVVKVEDESD